MTIDHAALRLLIRAKLADGRLPVSGISRIWGAPGNAESCDACEVIVTDGELVMEGIAVTPVAKTPMQLHVRCFYMWDDERGGGQWWRQPPAPAEPGRRPR